MSEKLPFCLPCPRHTVPERTCLLGIESEQSGSQPRINNLLRNYLGGLKCGLFNITMMVTHNRQEITCKDPKKCQMVSGQFFTVSYYFVQFKKKIIGEKKMYLKLNYSNRKKDQLVLLS